MLCLIGTIEYTIYIEGTCITLKLIILCLELRPIGTTRADCIYDLEGLASFLRWPHPIMNTSYAFTTFNSNDVTNLKVDTYICMFRGIEKKYTVFPHIVSAETILF